MRALDIRPRFERELRKYKRAHGWRDEFDELLELAIDRLLQGLPLPAGMSDHPLRSEYAGFRDFHLDGDTVVIYRLTAELAILHRIGTHADLFMQPLASR